MDSGIEFSILEEPGSPRFVYFWHLRDSRKSGLSNHYWGLSQKPLALEPATYCYFEKPPMPFDCRIPLPDYPLHHWFQYSRSFRIFLIPDSRFLFAEE